MEFPDLPAEIRLNETLIRLDPLSLLSYCEIDSATRRYCSSPIFRRVYNKKYSHDDYQYLVENAAYENDEKSFLILVNRANYFDQIVDILTLDKSSTYFAENANETMIKQIRKIEKMGMGEIEKILNRFKAYETLIQIIKDIKNSLSSSVLGYSKLIRQINPGINVPSDVVDIYLFDLVFSVLSESKIKRLLTTVKSRSTEFFYNEADELNYLVHIFRAIVRKRDFDLLYHLYEYDMDNLIPIVIAIIIDGNLEDYLTFELGGSTVAEIHKNSSRKISSIFLPRGGESIYTIPRNKDLYLYILHNSKPDNLDLVTYLTYGCLALTPEEWIETVDKGAFIDPNLKRDLYMIGKGTASNEGYTYFAQTIEDAIK